MISNKKLFIAIAAFIFFLGCVDTFDDYKETEGAPHYTESYLVTELSDNCYCFVCKNGTESTWPFDILYKESLKEGSCSFMSNCTNEELSEAMENEFFPQPFMLGMGPRAWDFTYANTFCNNSLRMSVEWLVSDGSTYEMPSGSTAECFLEKQVIPVYILYSNSEAVNATSAGMIAEEMAGRGPVILVSEIDFDSSDNEVIIKVQEQIIEMRNACPRPDGFEFGTLEDEPYCLIAVAPKLGDYEALNEVLADPDVNESVDLIAIGVNSHRLNSSFCKASDLYFEAIEFSEYAWFNKSKPVIWPYMLFDLDGGNIDDSCIWSQESINHAYDEFFKIVPNAMAVGVIGAAPYQFYGLGSDYDPLECNDCGLIQIEGGQLAPKEPLFSSWFHDCQNYLPEYNYLFISFSQDEGGTCNIGFSPGWFASTEVNTDPAAEVPTAHQNQETLIFSCMECIDDCEDDEDECDTNPYNIPAIDASGKCSGFTELDLWAGIRGIDPAFVRAIAWSESGLDSSNPDNSYCQVSFPVAMESACNDLDVQRYIDPTGYCQERLDANYEYWIEGKTVSEVNALGGTELIPECEGAGDTGCYDSDSPVKPCAVGLMQVHPDQGGYPYTYWDIADSYVEGSSWEEDREMAASCAPDGQFNPFNGSHSACMGTSILKGKLDSAENLLEPHWDTLEADTSSEREWLTAFLAAYLYTGYSDLPFWVEQFESRKEVTTDSYCSSDGEFDVCCNGGEAVENACCNNDDNFVAFVTCCVDYDSSRNDYGYCDSSVGGNSNSWCNDKEDFECGTFNPDIHTIISPESAAYKMAGFRQLVKYHSLNEEGECSYACGDLIPLANNILDFCERYEDNSEACEAAYVEGFPEPGS